MPRRELIAGHESIVRSDLSEVPDFGDVKIKILLK